MYKKQVVFGSEGRVFYVFFKKLHLIPLITFFIFKSMEVESMNIKEIRKALMTGKGTFIKSKHTKKRMEKRGYTNADIISAIFNGAIVERQGNNKVVIAGKDKDDNPIVIIMAQCATDIYMVVTVMPPTDHTRFIDCI